MLFDTQRSDNSKRVVAEGINNFDTNEWKDRFIRVCIGIASVLAILLGILFGHAAIYTARGENISDAFAKTMEDFMSLDHPLNQLPITPSTALAYLIAVLISTLIGILVASFTMIGHKPVVKGISGGTAKWNDNIPEYNKKFNEPFGKSEAKNPGPDDPVNSNMPLTEHVQYSFLHKKIGKTANILLIGSAGKGKSFFVMKPNIMRANCSFIVTDPSGELTVSCGNYLQKQGYDVRIFSTVDMKHSRLYNPFEYIDKNDDSSVQVLISCLIENTNSPNAKSGDDFWEKSEKALFAALIYYTIEELPPKNQNFNTVLQLIHKGEEVADEKGNVYSELDQMFKQIDPDKKSLARENYDTFKLAEGKTRSSILISAAVRLNPFLTPELLNLTCADNLDLASIGDQKTVLFVTTPQTNSTFNFLVSMLYSQAFQVLYAKGEAQLEKTGNAMLPVHVRFMLDEFANIGKIPNFPQKLSTMRKYNLSTTVAIQDITQLQQMYDKEWQTIDSNSDVKLFLGGGGPDTTKYVSEHMLGSATIRTESESLGDGKKKGSRSISEKDRPLLRPEEVGNLPGDKAIIKINGVNPFLDIKYRFQNDWRFQYTGDGNPDFIFSPKKDRSYDVETELQTIADINVAKESGAEYMPGMQVGMPSQSLIERLREYKNDGQQANEDQVISMEENLDEEDACIEKLKKKISDVYEKENYIFIGYDLKNMLNVTRIANAVSRECNKPVVLVNTASDMTKVNQTDGQPLHFFQVYIGTPESFSWDAFRRTVDQLDGPEAEQFFPTDESDIMHSFCVSDSYINGDADQQKEFRDLLKEMFQNQEAA